MILKPSNVTGEIAPIMLRPKKSTTILCLLGSFLFLALSVDLAVSGRWVGYLGAAFCAFCIHNFIIQLSRDSTYLQIGSDEFTVCKSYRKQSIPWSAVDKFFVVNINPLGFSKIKGVGYNLIQSHGLPAEMLKGFIGSEAILPQTYGKKAEALAELMNACLLKARAKNTKSSITEVPSTYQTEIIATRYVKSGLENAQIRELDISHQSRALRFLRPADYALVILCGLWLIRLSTGIGAGVGILDLLFIGFMLFCVHTGWRHVGVIDSRAWKIHIIVFPVLLISCLVILVNTDVESNLKEGKVAETLMSILNLLCIASAAISGLISVLLLSTTRIGGVNIALPRLLSKLRNRRISPGFNPRSLKSVNKRRGILLGVLGIIIILSTSFAPLPNIRPIGQLMQVYRFIQLFGFLLLVFAQRYLQAPAASLLSSDKRRPILFLRSFEDDENQQFKTSDKSFLDFSLETRLAKHFGHFGPFIAIGSPKESVPLLGASRAILSDWEWQSNVISWIEKSSLIIMYAGKTHWVNWELAKVIEAGRIPNLILMVPELSGPRRKRYEELALRFERVRYVFRNMMWSRSLAGLQGLNNVRAITFCEDGSIVAIKSRARNRDSYHLAALVAHCLILNEAVS